MITVLVADDSASFRDLVRITLRSQGWTVVESDDPSAVVSLAREHTPDVVLLDVVFEGAPAGIDGFAICRALKADPAVASIPVIMLSARDAGEDLSEGRGAGAAHYLIKPFGPIELIDSVRFVVSDPAARAGLGLYLVAEGLVTHEQLRSALARHRQAGGEGPIGEVLVSMGVVSSEDLARAVARSGTTTA